MGQKKVYKVELENGSIHYAVGFSMVEVIRAFNQSRCRGDIVTIYDLGEVVVDATES